MATSAVHPFTHRRISEQIKYLYVDFSWLEDYKPSFFPFAHYLTPQEFVLAFASIPFENDCDYICNALLYPDELPLYFKDCAEMENYVMFLQERIFNEYYFRMDRLIESLQLPRGQSYVLEKFVTHNTGLIRLYPPWP